MSDNPLANILARLIGERSDVAARAFERAVFDFARARGCDLGGVCASRLYPEAPRAHDAVRLRCPLRRSPDRGVTLCVEQPTMDCVTAMRQEA